LPRVLEVLVKPEIAQVGNRVDASFLGFESCEEVIVHDILVGQKSLDHLVFLFDEGNDGLAEVLRDVLSVVFHFPDVQFLPWPLGICGHFSVGAGFVVVLVYNVL